VFGVTSGHANFAVVYVYMYTLSTLCTCSTHVHDIMSCGVRGVYTHTVRVLHVRTTYYRSGSAVREVKSKKGGKVWMRMRGTHM
jgi:hypothetical protein